MLFSPSYYPLSISKDETRRRVEERQFVPLVAGLSARRMFFSGGLQRGDGSVTVM